MEMQQLKSRLQQIQEELERSQSFIQHIQANSSKSQSQQNQTHEDLPQSRFQLSSKKIVFYYAGLGNSSQPFAGSSSALVTLATALAKTNTVSVDITGDRIKYKETYQGVTFLPLPQPEDRDAFLSTYDVVIFATHLRAFSKSRKSSQQLWILHQHCWAVEPNELERLNDFDTILCLSDIHRQAVINQSIAPEKIQVIPNIVDTEIFSPQPVDRKKNSIMFAGAVVEHKGLHILLAALPAVQNTFPDAEVHIYGSAALWHENDAYENQMRSLGLSAVYFHGVVSRNEMPRIYSQHSILCLPSELESFGLVAVEAQACGCIPVVHNAGGVAATLVAEQTGFLYSPNAAEELANIIVKALKIIEVDGSIRNRAVSFVRDNFNSYTIVTKAREFFQAKPPIVNVAPSSSTATAPHLKPVETPDNNEPWKSTFVFKGRHIPYNRVTYNNPPSERTVEVAIALDFFANLHNKTRLLEVGNVLSNYEELFTEQHSGIKSRRIVDKFEKAVGVENEDLMNLPSTEKYNAIISISTVEHIGQGVEPASNSYGEKIDTRNLEYPLEALAKIYELLAIDGKALITVPFGRFTDYGWFIQFGQEYLNSLGEKYNIPKKAIWVTYLKIIARETTGDYPRVIWVESDAEGMRNVEFGSPFYAANGIAVIELSKISSNIQIPEPETKSPVDASTLVLKHSQEKFNSALPHNNNEKYMSETLVNIEESSGLIPPEIKDDEFYLAIQTIARTENIKTVLEIGSSSGEGSTEAFVTGLRSNPHRPTLFCMEVSRPRFAALQKRYANESFVKCYNVSSVAVEQFPTENEVRQFYLTTPTALNNYSLEMVIGWLRGDIDYLNNSGVTLQGIRKIKQENKIDFFDLVLIDGSEFTGIAELDEVYGAKIIALDDVNAFKNYNNRQRLLADPNYELVSENIPLRNGYSIFKKTSPETVNEKKLLPIHFFTIVLNGEPFIHYHIEVFKQLPFQWHWHVVEGVAELKHDTAWSIELGGHIADELHRNGRSNDGTTEYLDALKRQYPENITLYRKPAGVFWDGKREMVKAPLANINEECLLWQVDVDELWTLQQICTARQMFVNNPDKTAAWYWCWYFVGENLVISTRNCYAQNPQQEWLRTWRFKPGMVWEAHEPPRLVEPLLNGQWRNVAAVNPFLHDETEKQGLVFQHFAYVTINQLQFKEKYYGYKNAVSQWLGLQAQSQFPILLRQHLAWVQDETAVNTAESCHVVPIARKQIDGTTWQFRQSEDLPRQTTVETEKIQAKVVVDGVFFQLNHTGIARVWNSLLEEWVANGFAKQILVIDRAGTAPKIAGLRYRTIPAYDYNSTDSDRRMLQQVCDETGAELFISTYYTTPLSTPSVFMAYDMIPELVGLDLDNPQWREKRYGIRHASAYIAISENTARNLVGCFPDISLDAITVAHCGVKSTFSPASSEGVAGFKSKYGIFKPYFILVGERVGWQNCKNALLFFKAFYKLPNRFEFDIVCVGGRSVLELEFVDYTSGCTVHLLRLSDEELRTAYCGAVGLVYPSMYEGFGMPILEAIACACPVITCPYGSMPEVAGAAALYVNPSDVNQLVNALVDIQKPEVRNRLIAAGLDRAKKFSWPKMAATVSSVLLNLADNLSLGRSSVLIESVKNEFPEQEEALRSTFDSTNSLSESLPVTAESNNTQPINEAFLSKEREFWNVESMYEAMFSRVFADETINQMSLQQKIESWNLSAVDSANQIIRGIPTKPEWKILEIGCGVGRVIKPLREMFAQVDGVDIAENMIQFAKEYLADGKQNGQVYVNNGCDLQELKNENYDFVYSMIVFQHIRSISVVKNYFSEIFRVLKPGGYFKIQVHDYQDNPAAGKFDEEADAETQYAFAGNGYTDEQLRGLLTEQGFDVVLIEWQSPWIWATVQRPEQKIISGDNLVKSQPTKAVLKVSAIVSTYNSEIFIRGCLQDLVEQTLHKKGELEIIVIDSYSEQNEQSIVREFQAKYQNIVYYRTPARETLYASWNRAIKMSRGKYITNANTDDRHRPDALEIMTKYLDLHPITSLVYANQLISTGVNDTWATTQAHQYLNWPPFDYKELERQCICGPQPMWRKSLHEKYGYFRSEFTAAGDYEFWLRIGKTENFVHLPEILGIYYHNPQGLSTSGSAPLDEPCRIWEEYGIHREGIVPANVTATISLWELNALPYRTLQPLASVIICTKDRPEMLVEAVQSVLNQTYPNVEIVVVNDGGTEVQQVLNPLNTKGNIVYLSHPQTLDRSAARNTGIRAARGKYIAYLDDDDIYYPNHIETLVKFLENSEYKIAYTDAVMAQQEKQNGEYVTVHRSVPYSLDFDNDKILVSNCTPNLCLMHEKSCLDEVGLFDESLSTHEDWDLIIRLSRKFNIAHIKETTCEFTQRNDGTNTSSHNRADFTRTRDVIFNQYRQYAEANSAILAAQKEAFIAEAKELAQQVQNLQSQVIQKESDLQQTQAEKSQLAAQLETWQRSAQQVQAKLEATQSEKEWVKSQLNSWKQTAEEMQIELEHSRSKLKQAQSQLERSAFPIGKS
jgi:glycosyltransferase involved in cell wall biosynthesis/cyclopropane fatty-acyl-phospholipid synthase-like methyltransferase